MRAPKRGTDSNPGAPGAHVESERRNEVTVRSTYSAVPDGRKEIGMRQPVTLRAVISLLGIATLVLVAGSFAIADITPPPPPPPGEQCDFLTRGGFIFPTASKGALAIAGGGRPRPGGNRAPCCRHLGYH